MEGAGGRTTLLALQDASVHAPLGMYLHSRWVPLSRGPRPLLTGDTCVENLSDRVRSLLNAFYMSDNCNSTAVRSDACHTDTVTVRLPIA